MKRKLRMSEGIFIVTLLITLLLCQGLFAAEETLPTPEEIIAKNIEAIGGIEALNKIKNKKIVQIRKFVQMNMVIKFIEYRERPNNAYRAFRRLDNEVKGSNVKMEWLDMGVKEASDRKMAWEGSDGKMAWEISPDGARLFEGNVLPYILFNDLFNGLDGHDARYKSMKTEGIEQINGKDCYKVVKSTEEGPGRIVYYDKNTYMIVKTISYFITPEGNTMKSERYVEEYKKINGILFPYKEVEYQNGQKYSEHKWEQIELNIEMPKGIFDIPEEIKAIMNKK